MEWLSVLSHVQNKNEGHRPLYDECQHRAGAAKVDLCRFELVICRTLLIRFFIFDLTFVSTAIIEGEKKK